MCLRALANGSPSVTGIEINPIIVTDDHARQVLRIMRITSTTDPDVHIYVNDGRSFIPATVAISTTWCR